ncbi:glycosyltransferase family 2 protein [Helicobacter labetoulli]|uniref:glycosyltransferase family 2 protein n=1 Tax=Helicobacter labetoulli TaxID=2315333 RepID=UPI000EF6E028|nr:glycosyltransferase family 2 protein [Helicobacter labetoulli]
MSNQKDNLKVDQWEAGGSNLRDHYTKAEQYAMIQKAREQCEKYMDPNFDPSSFVFPRDNFAVVAHIESRCVFTQDSSSQDAPLFTIAIPTFNRVETLRRTLLSALKQNFSWYYEVIVVENPNNTTFVAESMLLDEFRGQITYYQNSQNIGGYNNWNRCLELARGKWVCLLHSDDELLPQYLGMMQKLVANPSYKEAYLIGVAQEDDSTMIYPKSIMQKIVSNFFYSQPYLLSKQMQPQKIGDFVVLPPSAVLHNRAKCIGIGGYDENEFPSADMTFFNRAAISGDVYCYRAMSLVIKHPEISCINNPSIALMFIMQNPQMLRIFNKKNDLLGILMGNYIENLKYVENKAPLVKLYAQNCLHKQIQIFQTYENLTPHQKFKMYLKINHLWLFVFLKNIKNIATGNFLSLQSTKDIITPPPLIP